MAGHGIKRGHLVEFTDTYYRDYPPVDTSAVRFGVAIEDETEHKPIRVKIADGSIVVATYVHAYAWAGWIPDGLEEVLAEFEPATDDWV